MLGLHAIKEKPVAVNGKVEIRPVCIWKIGAENLAKHLSDDVSGSHV